MAACDASTDKPYHIGREFQVRIEIAGRCRVKMLELVAHAQQEDVTGLCAASEACAVVRCQEPDDYAYLIEPNPVPTPAPTGACCIGTSCVVMTAADCALAGGTYQGDGVACGPATCGGGGGGEGPPLPGLPTYVLIPVWPITEPPCQTGHFQPDFWTFAGVDGDVGYGADPATIDPGVLSAWSLSVWQKFSAEVVAHGLTVTSASISWIDSPAPPNGGAERFFAGFVFPALSSTDKAYGYDWQLIIYYC